MLFGSDMNDDRMVGSLVGAYDYNQYRGKLFEMVH